MECPVCRCRFIKLQMHYHHSPACRPARPIATKQVPALKKPKVTDCARTLFKNRTRAVVGKHMLKAHIDHHMSITHLDQMMNVLVSCVDLVLDFIESEAQQDDAAWRPALEVASIAFQKLPAAHSLIREQQKSIMRAIPRNLSTTGDDKSGAAFFSAHQLVTIMLQESQAARQWSVRTSDELKTGKLYRQYPNVITDMTQGRRYRDWQAVCGAASAEEADDHREVLVAWTDEFTPLDATSQRARKHKYGVVTAVSANLPLRIRYYHDFILLLAVYNSRYAKKNGGLSRMLTGIGSDGKEYNDGVTFAAELALGTESPYIEFPNDADPRAPPRRVRLRLFLLLISLDWLASGDFGPFAGSVSARYPCGKCMWTANCPCAHLSANDPRRKKLKHSTHCRASAPRTHDSVLVEMRKLQPLSLTARKSMSTTTGIFSSYCASEHLLRDMVKDSTIDIMHVFLCGWTRYLFSFVTDSLIPSEFSWDDLNKNKRAYSWKRNVRVPDLEYSLGSTRGSKSIHLNAGEMMHFALARCLAICAVLLTPPSSSLSENSDGLGQQQMSSDVECPVGTRKPPTSFSEIALPECMSKRARMSCARTTRSGARIRETRHIEFRFDTRTTES